MCESGKQFRATNISRLQKEDVPITKAAEPKLDSPKSQANLFSLVSQSHAVRDEVEKALGDSGGVRVWVEVFVPDAKISYVLEELTTLMGRFGKTCAHG